MADVLGAKRLSRRGLLGVLAVAAVVPAMQACAGMTPDSGSSGGSSSGAAETKPAASTPAESKAGATAPAAGAKTTPAASGTTGQTAPAAKGETIEISTRGGSDGEIMEKSIVDFAKDTGIQAKHVAYGAEPEYWAKVQSLYATKQVADVIWASLGNLHNFANRGVLAELDPLIKADNYDTSDYVPNGLASCSLNGKLYAMPWGGHPGNGGLLYNTDLLEEAGLKPPDASWTLETLADAARKLTKQSNGRTEVFGFSAGTDFLSVNNFTGGYGAEFFTPPTAGKELTIEDEKFKAGLNYMRDFFVTMKAAPTPGPDLDTANLFASGKIALLQSGYWGQFSPGEKAIAGKFKWGVDLIPKGPAGKMGSSLTINGLTVSSISEVQSSAWQFLKWMMEPKNHIPIVLAGGSRPALRNSVLDDPQLNEKLPAHKRFVEAIKAADPWKEPANYRWPEFSTTVGQVFADLWTGNKTVDEALPDAKTRFQAVIDKAAID